MEKTLYSPLHFDDVSEDAVERLRKYLTNEDGDCTGKTSGLAETPCFTAKYAFDPKAKQLMIEPLHLVKGLRGKLLHRIITDVMAPPQDMLAVTGDDYTPTPHQCAVYNWCIGFMTNNTGLPMTYSGEDTDHGTIIRSTGSIPVGATPADQDPSSGDAGKAGVFQNKGGKDSVTGCFGKVSWLLGDNATTLALDYGVNTLSATSATTSLSGPNASQYTASVENKTHFYGACAYLYPYVTITKNAAS